jgi:hypothetical protein
VEKSYGNRGRWREEVVNSEWRGNRDPGDVERDRETGTLDK